VFCAWNKKDDNDSNSDTMPAIDKPTSHKKKKRTQKEPPNCSLASEHALRRSSTNSPPAVTPAVTQTQGDASTEDSPDQLSLLSPLIDGHKTAAVDQLPLPQVADKRALSDLTSGWTQAKKFVSQSIDCPWELNKENESHHSPVQQKRPNGSSNGELGSWCLDRTASAQAQSDAISQLNGGLAITLEQHAFSVLVLKLFGLRAQLLLWCWGIWLKVCQWSLGQWWTTSAGSWCKETEDGASPLHKRKTDDGRNFVKEWSLQRATYATDEQKPVVGRAAKSDNSDCQKMMPKLQLKQQGNRELRRNLLTQTWLTNHLTAMARQQAPMERLPEARAELDPPCWPPSQAQPLPMTWKTSMKERKKNQAITVGKRWFGKVTKMHVNPFCLKDVGTQHGRKKWRIPTCQGCVLSKSTEPGGKESSCKWVCTTLEVPVF
jgi:hypothetical protein